MPPHTLGPDPTEWEALYDEQVTLQGVFHEAMASARLAGRSAANLSLLYTRIALLDAELRRN